MRRLIVIVTLVFVSYIGANAQLGIGFSAGLSTPNDEINNVYNSDNFELSNTENLWGNLKREATESGFHIGAKLRLPLTESMVFTGGVMWNRFPETRIDVEDPNNPDSILVSLSTYQNIVPISVGLNYYLLNSFVGLYGTGDLSYNYISGSVDYIDKNTDMAIPLESSPTDHRVGFGLGVGMDIDLQLLLVNVEAKYNMANLIGMKEDEEAKSYYTLTLSVFLGDSSPKDD